MWSGIESLIRVLVVCLDLRQDLETGPRCEKWVPWRYNPCLVAPRTKHGWAKIQAGA